MSKKDKLNQESRGLKSDPYGWIEHGNTLLQAAAWTIKTPVSHYMHEDPPDPTLYTGIEAASMQRRSSRTHIFHLLLGSALECFLKAHPENSDKHSHDCLSLARDAGIEIQDDEKQLISELSNFIVIGRYPYISNKEFRQLNSGKGSIYPTWSAIDNEASQKQGTIVKGSTVHFGPIDEEMAEIELQIVRKIRESMKSKINYKPAPQEPC